jgi:hypothetical protein
MDSGKGHLELLNEREVKALGGADKMDTMNHYFRVGEELEIKGSRFRIQSAGFGYSLYLPRA